MLMAAGAAPSRNVGKVIQRRCTAAAWTSNFFGPGVDTDCVFVYTVYTVMKEVNFILSQADGRPMYGQIMDQVAALKAARADTKAAKTAAKK